MCLWLSPTFYPLKDHTTNVAWNASSALLLYSDLWITNFFRRWGLIHCVCVYMHMVPIRDNHLNLGTGLRHPSQTPNATTPMPKILGKSPCPNPSGSQGSPGTAGNLSPNLLASRIYKGWLNILLFPLQIPNFLLALTQIAFFNSTNSSHMPRHAWAEVPEFTFFSPI